MNKPQHAPLPYNFSLGALSIGTIEMIDINGRLVCEVHSCTYPDVKTAWGTAEFLKRACNSHHDLIEALENLIKVRNDFNDADRIRELYEVAEQVLVTAKGEF